MAEKKLQENLNKITAEKTALTTQLNQEKQKVTTLTQDKTKLTQDLTTVTQEKTALTTQLNKEKENLTVITQEKTKLTNDLATMTQQKTTITTQLDEEKQKVTTLTQEKTKLTGDLAKANQQKKTLTTQLNEEKQKVTVITQEKTKLTNDLANMTQQKTAITTQLDQEKQKVTTLTQEKTKLTKDLAAESQEKEALITKLNEEIQKLTVITQEKSLITNNLATITQQKTDLTNKLTQEKQQFTDEKNQLQGQIETINNEKNELQNKLTQKQEQLNLQKEENEKITSDLNSVNAEKQQLLNEIQILKDKNVQLTNNLTELTNINEQFQLQKEEVTNLEQQLSDLNQEKTTLEQQQNIKLYYQNVSEFTQFNQTLNMGTLTQMFDDGFCLKFKEELDKSLYCKTCVVIDGQKGSGKTFVLNGIANLNLEEDQKIDYGYQLQIVKNTEENKLEDVGFLLSRCKGNSYPIDKQFNELKENYQKTQDKKKKVEMEIEYNQMVQKFHQQLKENSIQTENEYDITQQLIKEFIYQQYDILIYCVEDFDREQQKDYQDIIANIKNNQKVFVVHVCKDATYNTQDLVEKKIQKNMSQITCQIQGQQYTSLDNVCYQEFINCEGGFETSVCHLMIGYQESEDVRTNINEKTFKYLRDYIIDNRKKVKKIDIESKFLKFINEKLGKNDSLIKKMFQQYQIQKYTSEIETDTESQNDFDSNEIKFEEIEQEEENCLKYAIKKVNYKNTKQTQKPQCFQQNKDQEDQENNEFQALDDICYNEED